MRFLAFLLIVAGVAGILMYFEGNYYQQFKIADYLTPNQFMGSSFSAIILGFVLMLARR